MSQHLFESWSICVWKIEMWLVLQNAVRLVKGIRHPSTVQNNEWMCAEPHDDGFRWKNIEPVVAEFPNLNVSEQKVEGRLSMTEVVEGRAIFQIASFVYRDPHATKVRNCTLVYGQHMPGS
jgi:hypothetical protein